MGVFLSPDQIAGRMRRCHADLRTRISAQSIYTWIRASLDRDFWRSFLRQYRRTKGRGKAGKIPRSVDISGRPAKARLNQPPRLLRQIHGLQLHTRSLLHDQQG